MKKLRELLAPLELHSSVPPELLDQTVSGITVDSRKAEPGYLYVALAGAKSDGHEYVAEALAKGCIAAVVERELALDETAGTLLRVEDSHEAIGTLAAAWHDFPERQLSLIGITGTNGKTTTSWLIEGLLCAAGYYPGVIGTVTYRYTNQNGAHCLQEAPLTTPDPLTLQGLLRTMVDNGVTHVIMEVSSHALQQKRLGRTRFDVALFTNLSRDHLDYHQSMEHYFDAKKQLFLRHLKKDAWAVIVQTPEEHGKNYGAPLAAQLSHCQVLNCGLAREHALSASDLTQGVDGSHFSLCLSGVAKPFVSPLAGSYNVLNILAAAGVGQALGLSAEIIRSGLAVIGQIPGRLQRVMLPGLEASQYPAIFIDYAHTPDALENVLATLDTVKQGRLICLFGCGGDRDKGKRPQMGKIASQYAQLVIVTSDNPRTEQPDAILDDIRRGIEEQGIGRCSVEALFAAKGAQRGFTIIGDRHQAIHAACRLAEPADTILIAGKGHENYQIIGTEKRFFDDRITAQNALLAWNTRHLLAATKGQLRQAGRVQLLRSVSTDSRKIEANAIFVALRGDNFDGHDFLDQVADAGAGAIIAEELPARCRDGILYIQVKDSLVALGQLAQYRRQLLASDLQVIAITGSSGKTSVKEMVAAIFREHYKHTCTGIDPVLQTRGNFNNLIGLPLSLLPMQAGHKVAVLEMGMNAPGEIAQLTAIADPDIGCINNVHPAHLQGLGSLEGVARAKGELFVGMRADAKRVVNCDDSYVYGIVGELKINCVGFAASSAGRRRGATIRAAQQQNLGEQGMRFTLELVDWHQSLTVPVTGEHGVANCTAAAAIAYAAGVTPESIVAGLQRVALVDNRLGIKELIDGIKIVNDTYNANPASTAAGLQTVAGFGGANSLHVAVLGDMLELGDAAEALHRQIGALVAHQNYDYLAVTGSFATCIAEEAIANGLSPASVRQFAQPRDIADWLYPLICQGTMKEGDWIFVKGSRGMRMETFIEELTSRLQVSHPNKDDHVL